MEWSKARGKVLWLRGPAGAGKSAIAQTAAERCGEEGKPLACFFFLRGDAKRSHGKHLWATLASQIYTMFPEIRHSLLKIIGDNHSIFDQSRAFQFKKLVVEPLQALPLGVMNVVVVIDGLDECQDASTQNEILLLIAETFRTSPSLPAQFLIASRPEPNIRKTFDHPDLRQITLRIDLSDSSDSRHDIHTYLHAGFADIHEKNEGMHSTAKPWPSDWVLNLLVDRSSGQFIYASTVLKFIGDENFHPVGRLDAVINASDTRALSDLDQLYHQILSTCHPDNIDLLKIVLGMILTIERKQESRPNCTLLDVLLGLGTGYTRVLLRGLHSLLLIPDTSYPVTVLHKSFSDFLRDRSRSDQFHIDIAASHAWLSRRCMEWIMVRQEDILFRRLEGVQ